MSQAQIRIQEMQYQTTSGQTILKHISLALMREKIALVGPNGCGKSTLLKLITGELQPSSGTLQVTGQCAYVPQVTHFAPHCTVANVLGVEKKFLALQRIEQGSTAHEDYAHLDEDWGLRARWQTQLQRFALAHLALETLVSTLSGGELTRLLLCKAFASDADFILLDEPTNHLDSDARTLLYHAIAEWSGGLIVASHDRQLLSTLSLIIEITPQGIERFSGDYKDYETQKAQRLQTRIAQHQAAKQHVTQIKSSIQQSKEKHAQRRAYGEKSRERNDQPKVLLDKMKDRSTASQGSDSTRHQRMLNDATDKLAEAKANIHLEERINVTLPDTFVPQGKEMLRCDKLSFQYEHQSTRLIDHMNLTLSGPSRIALAGPNGSGKSTLIKLCLQQLQPQSGRVTLGTPHVQYIDQNMQILDPQQSILDNYLRLNAKANSQQAYHALAQFLFKNQDAKQKVAHLSGGEKLRAALACTLLSSTPTQLLILDEPTNHLDLPSIQCIEDILNAYQGALIVISHDQHFLTAIHIERVIHAPFTHID